MRPRPGSSTGAVVSSANSLPAGFELQEQALIDRPQQPGSAPNPVSQRRAIEINALACDDLRLAIKRQVIGIFGHQHMRDGRIGRQTALDQPRRSRRLDNAVLARAASVFGPANDQDPELRGNDIEPLAHIFTNAAQRALAARAILVLDVDHRLDARQMGGKRNRD